MGGHGGLNILPQKSWNVYNIKNQNIVRRDEERFRQEQAEAERQAQREEAEVRLAKLRERNPSSVQRFNLFEEEEKNSDEYEKKRRQAAIEKREKDKDTWYLSKAKPSRSWYERQPKLDDNGPEIRRRSEADPMNLVNSLLSQPQSPIRSHPNDDTSVRKPHKSLRKHKKEKEVDAETGKKRLKKHRTEKAKKGKRHRSPSSPTTKESRRAKKRTHDELD